MKFYPGEEAILEGLAGPAASLNGETVIVDEFQGIDWGHDQHGAEKCVEWYVVQVKATGSIGRVSELRMRKAANDQQQVAA